MSYVSVSPGLGALQLPAGALTSIVRAPAVTVRKPTRTSAIVMPVTPIATPAPTPEAPPQAPVGEPQPLASLFVQKLAELAAQGIVDIGTDEFPRVRALTEEQLRAAVASIEAKGKKGALQVRAAFEQAVAEFAEKRKQKMLIAGAGIAVAAIVGFVLWKRRKA